MNKRNYIIILFITYLCIPLFDSSRLQGKSLKNITINKSQIETINLLSTNNNWQDSWYDNSKTGALLKKDKDNGTYILEGDNKSQSYGCIYQDVRIDFSQFAELEIDIKHVKGNWYLLIADQSFIGGYVHIQRDTMGIGKFKYDLRKITGYTKPRTVQLQLGITSASSKPNKNYYVKIKGLKLNKTSAANQITNNVISYIPEEEKNMHGWKDQWKDGAPTGANISFKNSKGIIMGTEKKQNYGFVAREVAVDLDKYPILELSISEVSKGWYLLLFHPDFEGGYYKLERYSSRTGLFEYDIPQLTKLSGTEHFDIALGSVVEELNARNNLDQTVAFNYIKFKNQKTLDYTNLSELKNPLKEIDINSVSINNKFYVPEELNINKVQIISRKDNISEMDLKSENSFSQFEDINELFQELSHKENVNIIQDSEFQLSENEESIVIQNKNYEILFDKSDGHIKHIVNNNQNELIGDNQIKTLWDLEFNDKSSLSSKNLNFSYILNKKDVIFKYEDKSTSSLIKLTIIPNAKNYLDFEVTIENKFNKDIVSFSLPKNLVFPYKNLKEFVFPFKLGLAFNQNFFSQKRQLTEKYPSLFADCVSINLNRNRISIYGIQKNDSIFQPANLSTGYSYEASMGYYTHTYITYVYPNQKFQLPIVRINFNPEVQAVINDYREVNEINQASNLKDKLGEVLYNRLKQSVLLKVEVPKNRDFHYIKSFIPYLSKPTLVHLVTYWEKGFDKNYPDFLPPDEAYGTLNEMKDLCEFINETGNICMPYVNPTWWNESTSLTNLKAKLITLKDVQNAFITEYYNNSLGYVVDPYHPSVINRVNQLVDDFVNKTPVNILFEDQLGARPWFYSYSTNLPTPYAYIQGIINMAKRDSQKVPLFTEEGFDRLIPYECGFCNMSTANNLPPDDTYNVRFGNNTWSIYPLALYMAHDKVAFYQHNLAHEVFADENKKITWNLVYGHNLNIGRWISSWSKQIKEYKIADAIQKELIANYFDKKLTYYEEIDEKVYLSQFEDIIVIGNLSSANYKIGRYTIAPNGFFVINKEGTLLAGIFTKFNGQYLGGERIIILKKEENDILLKQLAAENSFISIPKPENWKLNSLIESYYGDERIPFISTKDGIALYLKYNQDSDWYKIRYNDKRQSSFDVQIDAKRDNEYA